MLDNKNDEFEKQGSEAEFINHEKMEQFYSHLEQCMLEVGYYDKNNPRKLMHRIRRLFNRAQLDETEFNIMRGFLSKIQNIKTNN